MRMLSVSLDSPVSLAKHNSFSPFLMRPLTCCNVDNPVQQPVIAFENTKQLISSGQTRKLLTAVALVTLVLQNSGLTLLMRLSRLPSSKNQRMYFTSSAVVLCEILKLISYTIIYLNSACENDINIFFNKIKLDVEAQGAGIYKISIPAALYVLQNNLQYIASSNLPAQVYQVLMQLKIITTAIFSVFLLNKRPSKLQWLCIVSLFIGVAIVQLSFQSVQAIIPGGNSIVGIVSVLLTCLTSGLAGVYFEKILKTTGASIWLRNIQLALISVFFAGMMCIKDLEGIKKYGFFHGFDALVLVVVAFQASGGIIVPLVVKYTDSIVKGFATSASIVTSYMISKILFNDVRMNSLFALGAAIVSLSGFFYGQPANFFDGKKK